MSQCSSSLCVLVVYVNEAQWLTKQRQCYMKTKVIIHSKWWDYFLLQMANVTKSFLSGILKLLCFSLVLCVLLCDSPTMNPPSPPERTTWIWVTYSLRLSRGSIVPLCLTLLSYQNTLNLSSHCLLWYIYKAIS